MKILIEIGNRPEPAWKEKFPQWNLLNEVSYAFCEALHRWEYLKDRPHPDVIFLALPEGSNLSDFEFVEDGAKDPGKFIFTFPNMQASIMMQILGFNGRVLCFNNGIKTSEFAKNECKEIAKTGKIAWLFTSPSVIEDEKRVVLFSSYPES
ncbi:hypothetical protein ACLVWU_13110 [Bdellovibrio sp. HCB290]|uniref:hypothetical protein n=1 Tax=Bdellovibrio sp. HCB290 TaxID=3394356 RepID=UPI0039B64A43